MRAGQEDNPPHVPGVRTSDNPRSGSNQRTEMEQLDQSDKSGDRDLSEEEEIRNININMYCNTLA